MVLTDTRPEAPLTTATGTDFSRAAFWLLRIGFGVLPIVVGIDKYFDHFVDWKQYLWAGVPNNIHLSAPSVMHIAGGVEIFAGLVVLFAPQIGGALVTVWLAGIVTNLALVAFDEHEYWDIMIRDIGLLAGAVALVLLATTYAPILGRKRHRVSTERSQPVPIG